MGLVKNRLPGYERILVFRARRTDIRRLRQAILQLSRCRPVMCTGEHSGIANRAPQVSDSTAFRNISHSEIHGYCWSCRLYRDRSRRQFKVWACTRGLQELTPVHVQPGRSHLKTNRNSRLRRSLFGAIWQCVSRIAGTSCSGWQPLRPGRETIA